MIFSYMYNIKQEENTKEYYEDHKSHKKQYSSSEGFDLKKQSMVLEKTPKGIHEEFFYSPC